VSSACLFLIAWYYVASEGDLIRTIAHRSHRSPIYDLHRVRHMKFGGDKVEMNRRVTGKKQNLKTSSLLRFCTICSIILCLHLPTISCVERQWSPHLLLEIVALRGTVCGPACRKLRLPVAQFQKSFDC
jgi:hypothetical protein